MLSKSSWLALQCRQFDAIWLGSRKIRLWHNVRSFLSTKKVPLMLKNTLSGRLEELAIDSEGGQKVLKWYSCGPTVYDSAHLGHARTYVCFDTIRRILINHFQYEVFYCLGMTDIDDKIIRRGWERGLAGRGWAQYAAAVARPEEAAFLADMDALGVRRPTAVARVSEHMGEIVAYVSGLLARGAAYVVPAPPGGEGGGGGGEGGGGDVLFDVGRMGGAYGRLAPARAGQGAQPGGEEGGEGSPGGGGGGGKRDPRDFALWKAAKAGEPAWPSPWGPGRPGWHIECSAMSHAFFGSSFDIHSGGIDLVFPHHTNEMAQCEAHNCSSSWVKYWLHTGHLHISGLKMSKSLKNFITVKEYLKEGSADEFRMFCLQYKYSANINYSPERLREARARARALRGALARARGRLGEPAGAQGARRWDAEDHELYATLQEARGRVLRCLAVDFDTPGALQALEGLAGRLAAHLTRRDQLKFPIEPAQATLDYLTSTLKSLGFSAEMCGEADMSFTEHDNAPQRALAGALVGFRGRVRAAALAAAGTGGGGGDGGGGAAGALRGRVLRLCDDLRDGTLPELGIEVDDQAAAEEGGAAAGVEERRSAALSWRFVAPRTPRPADPSPAADEGPKRQKQQSPLVHPSQFFMQDEFKGSFGAFDAQGFPTHDANMMGITKTSAKKLRKKLEKYSKKFHACTNN